MLKQYETVFIATPVLSDTQMKDAVAKYTDLIKANGGEVVYEEDWGLKQLAYSIQHKTSGFYYLIEFNSATSPSLSTRTPPLTPRREGTTKPTPRPLPLPQSRRRLPRLRKKP